MTMRWSPLFVLGLALAANACTIQSDDDDGSVDENGPSESSSEGAAEYVSSVEYDGTPARFRSGSPPEPTGDLQVTVPSSRAAINGGSTTVSLSASAEIVKVYMSIEGEDGYWEISVSAGVDLVDLLLTLAQSVPEDVFEVEFQVEDAQGNVSEPAAMQTTVTEVGTGELQVSVSWDVDNDIDLSVIDPNGFEIYYAADISPEGGELDLDSNPACSIDGINNENIRWLEGTAPRGSYQVVVTNYSNCTSSEANFVVTVQKAGADPATFSGSFPAEATAGEVVSVTEFEFP